MRGCARPRGPRPKVPRMGRGGGWGWGAIDAGVGDERGGEANLGHEAGEAWGGPPGGRRSGARGQRRLPPVTQGQVNPMPIAVSPFFGGTPPDAEFADNIPQVVAADLERSGLFRPIDRNAFIQDAASMRSQPPRFNDW